MNNRIKYLRKELLHLTMDEFGKRLGVGKSAISDIENGRNGLSNQMCNSICREFGVREEWIRDGKGDPFGPQDRKQKILAYMNRTLTSGDDSFQFRFTEALSELDEEEWGLLEKISLKLLGK